VISFLIVLKISRVQDPHEFWTDSNGLSMIKRIWGKRETFEVDMNQLEDQLPSANFYPVTSAIFVESCAECPSNIERNIFEKRQQADRPVLDKSNWANLKQPNNPKQRENPEGSRQAESVEFRSKMFEFFQVKSS
jgi:hypothetical protein